MVGITYMMGRTKQSVASRFAGHLTGRLRRRVFNGEYSPAIEPIRRAVSAELGSNRQF